MFSVQSLRRLPRAVSSKRNLSSKVSPPKEPKLAESTESQAFSGFGVPKSYEEFMKLPQLDPKWYTEHIGKVVDRSKDAMQGVVDQKLVAERFNQAVESSKNAMEGIMKAPKSTPAQLSGAGVSGGQAMAVAAAAGSGLLLWNFSDGKRSTVFAEEKVEHASADMEPETDAFLKYPMSQYAYMSVDLPGDFNGESTLAPVESVSNFEAPVVQADVDEAPAEVEATEVPHVAESAEAAGRNIGSSVLQMATSLFRKSSTAKQGAPDNLTAKEDTPDNLTEVVGEEGVNTEQDAPDSSVPEAAEAVADVVSEEIVDNNQEESAVPVSWTAGASLAAADFLDRAATDAVGDETVGSSVLHAAATLLRKGSTAQKEETEPASREPEVTETATDPADEAATDAVGDETVGSSALHAAATLLRKDSTAQKEEAEPTVSHEPEVTETAADPADEAATVAVGEDRVGYSFLRAAASLLRRDNNEEKAEGAPDSAITNVDKDATDAMGDVATEIVAGEGVESPMRDAAASLAREEDVAEAEESAPASWAAQVSEVAADLAEKTAGIAGEETVGASMLHAAASLLRKGSTVEKEENAPESWVSKVTEAAAGFADMATPGGSGEEGFGSSVLHAAASLLHKDDAAEKEEADAPVSWVSKVTDVAAALAGKTTSNADGEEGVGPISPGAAASPLSEDGATEENEAAAAPASWMSRVAGAAVGLVGKTTRGAEDGGEVAASQPQEDDAEAEEEAAPVSWASKVTEAAADLAEKAATEVVGEEGLGASMFHAAASLFHKDDGEEKEADAPVSWTAKVSGAAADLADKVATDVVGDDSVGSSVLHAAASLFRKDDAAEKEETEAPVSWASKVTDAAASLVGKATTDSAGEEGAGSSVMRAAASLFGKDDAAEKEQEAEAPVSWASKVTEAATAFVGKTTTDVVGEESVGSSVLNAAASLFRNDTTEKTEETPVSWAAKVSEAATDLVNKAAADVGEENAGTSMFQAAASMFRNDTTEEKDEKDAPKTDSVDEKSAGSGFLHAAKSLFRKQNPV